ncbi:NEAT domain-containing protein [Viridibacillus sp. YIM B01967]|uniref:NEAT domain-containing protein n=1 Tax=Viridibacillus soli TaxID=2798301 RepID=A0ABS1H678_9BACL|nr:NEAT domain-containing protein [Viridibacillus soli]MBK3494796.1 NEAT domain-containing protein [Viridibacillus soli]
MNYKSTYIAKLALAIPLLLGTVAIATPEALAADNTGVTTNLTENTAGKIADGEYKIPFEFLYKGAASAHMDRNVSKTAKLTVQNDKKYVEITFLSEEGIKEFLVKQATDADFKKLEKVSDLVYKLEVTDLAAKIDTKVHIVMSTPNGVHDVVYPFQIAFDTANIKSVVADGLYSINSAFYDQKTGLESTNMKKYANSQVVIKVEKNQKYAYLTLMGSSMIKGFKTVQNEVLTESEVVSTNALKDERVVKFPISETKDKLATALHVVVPGVYDTEHKLDLKFDTASYKLDSSIIDPETVEDVLAPSTNSAVLKVTNAKGSTDKIEISGVADTDIVKIYSDKDAKNEIGTKTGNGTIEKLNLSSTGGTLYYTVKSEGKDVSTVKSAEYNAEKTERSLKITTTNHANSKYDKVVVTGVAKGDVVKIYNADKKVLKTATATSTEVTFGGVKLGDKKTTIYVTAQAKGYNISSYKSAAVKAVAKSTKLKTSNITVTNAKGANDTITVKNLKKGDKVVVYNVKGKTIKGKTASSKTLKISKLNLGKKAGKVKISVIQAKKLESTTVTKSFSKEK